MGDPHGRGASFSQPKLRQALLTRVGNSAHVNSSSRKRKQERATNKSNEHTNGRTQDTPQQRHKHGNKQHYKSTTATKRSHNTETQIKQRSIRSCNNSKRCTQLMNNNSDDKMCPTTSTTHTHNQHTHTETRQSNTITKKAATTTTVGAQDNLHRHTIDQQYLQQLIRNTKHKQSSYTVATSNTNMNT